MPSRNVVKQYVPDSYYHVYNRGIEGRQVFLDEQDYHTFLSLLKRYLSKDPQKDNYGREGVTFYDDIELLAFCLMPTHFHLLVFVGANPRAVSEVMRRVCTAYTMYFNKKYDRVGKLFQGAYKASRITNDSHLLLISRYIHRNPEDYYNWPYSSYPYYIKDWQAEWVRPQKIYGLYEWGTYENFVNDHEDFHNTHEIIEVHLAG